MVRSQWVNPHDPEENRCFSCPGKATETVKESAMIHNVDLKELLEELNRAAA